MAEIIDLTSYRKPELNRHWTDLAESVDLLHSETNMRRFDQGQRHTSEDFPNLAALKYEAKGLEWIRNIEKERFALVLSELREEGYRDLVVEKQAYDRHNKPVQGSWAIYGKKP